MKIGVFNPIFDSMSLDEMLDHVQSFGLQAVEIRSGPNTGEEIAKGRYPGQGQFDTLALLEDDGKLRAVKQAFDRRGMTISALSCHGNPVHPDKHQAKTFHDYYVASVKAAAKLEVPVVVVFSGTPGGTPDDKQPNWITTAWPPEYRQMLDYQWNEVLIPYWRDAAKIAEEHGIKVAVEPHPSFCVYNPMTALRLREAVGETIGVNYDPSHLFWQGIDPVAAIRLLKDAIYHFHAKDTYIDPINKALRGVLDQTRYTNLAERVWYFRSIGYGHDQETWKAIISALRIANYDYVISIEHEDALASRDEGLGKAASFLKECILTEPPLTAFWA